MKPLHLAAFLASTSSVFAIEAAATDGISAEQRDFFEKKIRPVLADKCYKCHAQDSEKIKGGLTLDTRDGIRRGGDNGAAVEPGNLKDSLLIEALRYENKDFAMPPKKEGGKLSDAVIADFEKWVQMGAPDPREGAAKVVKKNDMEEAKKWWSFQPVKKPAAPAIKDAGWPRRDIDTFVLAGLEGKGMKPVADADKLTLLRRGYFDLIGLPPTLEEINAFLKDVSPDAFAKVVDRLLASPQFGERWGRHWLDVARFAESSGKDVNIAFPHAWRYRDYVIGAFNSDKPYDEFLREQIAGDLIPSKDQKELAEHLVATGFLAIGTKGLNERNPRQFAMDVVDEQIDTVSQAVLGLTVACARCHDHKFDPIPQRDYYALAGIFLSTETRYGTAGAIQNRHPSELIELPTSAGAPTLNKTLSQEDRGKKELLLANLKKEQEELRKSLFAGRMGGDDAQLKALPQRQPRALQLVTQIGVLESELKSFDASGKSKALAMGAQDRPAQEAGFGGGFGGRFRERRRQGPYAGRTAFSSITDSPLLARGEVDKPGEKISRGVPALLNFGEASAIPSKSSGRKELAEWITSSQNPMTARVMVNRVWHWLFGQGIVESVDNFGTMGQKPANPELLDFLATRLVENGWSLKRTIREIVLSHTYQLASTFDEKNFATDPENALNWRMSKRRLDAECIRDAMLSASGTLDLRAPIGSLIAESGGGPIGRFRGISEESIVNAGGNFRSVYLPVPRDVLPDALDAFDFAENSLVAGKRETTNVPSQALYLLNSPTVTAQAQKLADRVLAAYPAGPNGGVAANLDQRVAHAYWLTLSRAPDAAERQAASAFLLKFPANSVKGESSTPALRDAADVKAAWTSFCRALFASAEFRYLN